MFLKLTSTVVLSLITTRLIVKNLGVSDYGIFILIAGVIALLSFVNSAMTVTTQRFMSLVVGSGNLDEQKTLFSTSVILHWLLAFVIIALIELSGLFLFTGILNIDPARIGSAKILFHCMALSAFFTIISVPFDAVLNSHENLMIDALVGVLDGVGKLLIAFALSVVAVNKLELYGVLIMSLIISERIIKQIYCRKYQEVRFRFGALDTGLLKKMAVYAGWNTFEIIGLLARNQGITILINRFFGTVVNAAYGISYQISGQLMAFSSTILKAFSPQIIKAEGNGERKAMFGLAMTASKLSTFLFAFLAIPIAISIKYLLVIWLTDVPDYTTEFTVFTFVYFFIIQLSSGLKASYQAIGKIRIYQFVLGVLIVLNLPIGYVMFHIGAVPFTIIYSVIAIEIIICLFRIFYIAIIGGLNALEYLKKVVLKPVIVVLLGYVLLNLLYLSMHYGFWRVAVIFALSSIYISVSFYFLVFDAIERITINRLLRTKLLRGKKNNRRSLA